VKRVLKRFKGTLLVGMIVGLCLAAPQIASANISVNGCTAAPQRPTVAQNWGLYYLTIQTNVSCSGGQYYYVEFQVQQWFGNHWTPVHGDVVGFNHYGSGQFASSFQVGSGYYRNTIIWFTVNGSANIANGQDGANSDGTSVG